MHTLEVVGHQGTFHVLLYELAHNTELTCGFLFPIYMQTLSVFISHSITLNKMHFRVELTQLTACLKPILLRH